MLLRRVCLRCAAPEFIQPPRPPMSGFRRVARGVALGGLAGGLIGLGIEMSPEELGLRSKSKQWLEQGNDWINEKLFVPSKHKPDKEKESKSPHNVKQERQDAIPANENLSDVPPNVKQDENSREGVSLLIDESGAHVGDTTQVEDSTANGGETAHVEGTTHVEEAAHAKDSISHVEDLTAPLEASTSHIQESTAPLEASSRQNDTAEMGTLHARIADLEAALDSSQNEKERMTVRHAGELDAAFETMDRLYTEREEVVRICRHALVVNDLLQSLAASPLSPGALAVAFSEERGNMIEAAFSDELRPTFFKLFLGKLCALLYYEETPTVGHGPTARRLAAVANAKACIDQGDFYEAKNLLAANSAAKKWIEKLNQAILLWQGAETAVGSVHQDLLAVL